MEIQFGKFQGRSRCFMKGSRCLRFCSEALRAKRHVIHASVDCDLKLERFKSFISASVCFAPSPLANLQKYFVLLHERTDKLRDQIFKPLYPRKLKYRINKGFSEESKTLNTMFSVLVYVWKVIKTKMETLEPVSESHV